MIYVANVKTYNFKNFPSDAASVYIGRAMPGRPGSPLRNPFKLAKGESRDECLSRYVKWFNDLLPDSPEHKEMARLVEIARNGNLVLLCWCAPEKCHGDVIKEAIEAELKEDAR